VKWIFSFRWFSIPCDLDKGKLHICKKTHFMSLSSPKTSSSVPPNNQKRATKKHEPFFQKKLTKILVNFPRQETRCSCILCS
jgi:hypothetical protein